MAKKYPIYQKRTTLLFDEIASFIGIKEKFSNVYLQPFVMAIQFLLF